jgi:hypothetical protein
MQELMQPGRVIGKGRLGNWDVRPTSIPSTSLSETVRSTPLTVSLTVSVADFWAAKEVENARGANAETRGAERMAFLARKDIVIVFGFVLKVGISLEV